MKTNDPNGDLIELATAAGAGTDEDLLTSKFWNRMQRMEESGRLDRLRDVMLGLEQQNRSRISQLNYPDEVKTLVGKEFDKIVALASKNDWKEDSEFRIRSYLRILCFGRVPAGPEHFEIDGVPRNLLFSGGLSQTCRFAGLLARLGTLRPKPLYVLHLGFIPPVMFLLQYSAREQAKMLMRLADCLEMNPEVLGVSASSWWYDPAVKDHSDYLWYLREGCEKSGGEFFYYQSSDQDKRLATAGSEARTRLFDEGKYAPKSYMVVWTRASLLRWRDSQ